MQTDDAKTVRDVQKRFTQKYLTGLKENTQLKQQLAEAQRDAESAGAAAQAQAAALTAQLDAVQAAAIVDVRDMTENVLELEAKLRRTEQQRGIITETATETASVETREAPELLSARVEAQRLQAELAEKEREIEIAARQHILSQQAIRSLERRVRELEDERARGRERQTQRETAPTSSATKAAGFASVPPGTPTRAVLPQCATIVCTPPVAVPRASGARASYVGTDTVSTVSVSPLKDGLVIGIPQAEQAAVRERELREVPCKSGALKKHSKGKFAKDGQRHVQLFDWELWYQKNELNVPAVILDQPQARERAEAAKIELAHTRCIADVESDCVFHMVTHDRAYSFAAVDREERELWTSAICPCIHDAALVQASALCLSPSLQAGYLVLASRTGRGKNRRMDLDISKWKLQWWSLSENDTLDCHRNPPTGTDTEIDTEQSYDLLGAEITHTHNPGDLPPSFELTLSGTKSGKTVAAGGEKLRLFCMNETELHRWLLQLQAAIKRSRDPGSTKKGFLVKESQGENYMDHKRWFVVKSGVVRIYSKPTDAAWDTLEELDLRDALVQKTERAAVKPGHFVLQTPHKTLDLVAADLEEQQRWVEVLQKNIDAIEPDDVAQLTQQGYLQKRSSGLVADKTEPRWFTLHHGRLSCFKHERDSKPRWSLDLTEHSHVVLETSGTSSLGFTVHTATANDHKIVALTAANAHDLEVWVSVIQNVIAAAKVRAQKRGPKKPSTKRGRSPSCPNVLDLSAKGSEYITGMLVLKGEAQSMVPVKRRPRLKTRDLTAKMQKEHGAASRDERLAQKEPSVVQRRSSCCGLELHSGSLSTIARGVPTIVGRSTSVVIDLGSQFVRAGFSGELAPRVVVPTAMMTTRVAAESRTTAVFGWEAEKLLMQEKSSAQAEVILPRGNGSARAAAQEVDWYGAVLPLLQHVFRNELQVNPEQHDCVLILPTCMSVEDKEDLVPTPYNIYATYT